jgi:D-arabinono-1,4-lactone oxidase
VLTYASSATFHSTRCWQPGWVTFSPTPSCRRFPNAGLGCPISSAEAQTSSLESDCAYSRAIYHLHQELEFTVPYEATFSVSDRLIKLYEELYSLGLPYTLIEVRFTLAGHDATLIGAGRERRSTWIDIVCNDSNRFETYYAAAVDLIKELGGRPHLGKYCIGFDVEYLQKLHGEYFLTFQHVMVQHDPAGKFSNTFTREAFRTQCEPRRHVHDHNE